MARQRDARQRDTAPIRAGAAGDAPAPVRGPSGEVRGEPADLWHRGGHLAAACGNIEGV